MDTNEKAQLKLHLEICEELYGRCARISPEQFKTAEKIAQRAERVSVFIREYDERTGKILSYSWSRYGATCPNNTIEIRGYLWEKESQRVISIVDDIFTGQSISL